MLKTSLYNRLAEFDTPFYFYDMEQLQAIVSHVKELALQNDVHVHYAVKANADPRLLAVMSAAGFGADCVSGNEVLHSIGNGFKAENVMFAGVGKTDKEIRISIENEIGCFNVESLPELENIDRIASEMGMIANVAFRINPNVDAHTHKYITTGLDDNKFGISDYEFDAAVEALKACKSVNFRGLQFHVGSQITDVEGVFSLECSRALEIASYFESKGLVIKTLDFGGGLGINYDDPDSEYIPDFDTWFRVIRDIFPMDCPYELHIEPGRAMVANCGTLISKAVYVKQRRQKDFLILDAGMNDLLRPALYGSYHKIENLTAGYVRHDQNENHKYDVVGPVCESSDVWGEDRMLQESFRGDLIALRSAGAYGQTMASRYNLRDLAPSVYSDQL